ncbi:MAG: hypothetical protein F9K32_05450 [Desulfobulbaceae bacterium]|nr:MAG: hypothetical protein F9K32_05450 [Desulfobulbaceae bacterium]
MNQGHIRSTDQKKSKGQHLGKNLEKTREKRTDLIHTRQMVFSLSPFLLKAFIDFNDFSENDKLDDTMTEEEKIASIDESEQETDIEAKDEEDEPESVQEDESQSLDYDNLFGRDTLFDDSVTLLTNTVYAITVVPALNGGMRCWFEGPSWFSSKLSPEIQIYVNKLKTFLDALAQWLETEKQAFLQNPFPGNFVLREDRFSENPVVLQKGLLQRINKRIEDEVPLSEEEHEDAVLAAMEDERPVWQGIDESQFSRLLDKIWLLWPAYNMPLSNVFSSEYQLSWLVEVGTKYYREAGGSWISPELNYPDFSKKDLVSIKSKEFSTLTPEEKLHLLCARFKGGIGMAKSALKSITVRIESV